MGSVLEIFLSYYDKGGLIFLLLCILSVISVTIIIYKQILFLKVRKKNFQVLENQIELSTSKKILSDDLIKKKSLNTFSSIIYSLVIISNDSTLDELEKREKLKITLDKHIKELDYLLPTLEIISNVSPLMGLLGTVIGMINSFSKLEIGGSLVDPSLLAGGIWTALLTTAIGLIVAIPALVAHHFFEKKILEFEKSMSSFYVIFNSLKK